MFIVIISFLSSLASFLPRVRLSQRYSAFVILSCELERWKAVALRLLPACLDDIFKGHPVKVNFERELHRVTSRRPRA